MSQKKRRKQRNAVNYALIPLLLVIVLVPLIMHVYIYDSELSQFAWYPDRYEELDIFLYWKAIFLVIIAAVMTVILFVRLAGNFSEVKKDYWLYFLFGYGLLAFFSTVVSPYRSFGFNGIYEQFESIWVILSYCIVTFYAYYVVRNDKDLGFVRAALFALLFIMCCIGITQLTGHDFFESDLGRRIMVPEKYEYLRDELKFNFSGSGIHQVYLTLYNPNYVGAFAALILPVSMILAFSSKGIIRHLLWAAISVVLLVCTLGSGSKSFLLALGMVAVIALFFLRKVILKYWFIAAIFIAIMVAAGREYFSRMNVDMVQYVKNALTLQKMTYALEDVEATEEGASITYGGQKLTMQYLFDDSGVYPLFYDENGNDLEYIYGEDGTVTLSDERFAAYRFTIYSYTEEHPYVIAAQVGGIQLMFTYTSDGYRFVNNLGKIDDIAKAPSAIFSDYDRFASGRGYIWSRSIPLLGNYFFLGSGADTFSIAFPQYDYVGRINAGYYSQLITKPHDMYLQIGVQHGVLALLAMLAVCFIYFIQSCRIYWKADLTKRRYIFGVGLMLGIIGYLITGIANDSCVALAPLFWALLGIGYAVNRINRQEMLQQKVEAGQKGQESADQQVGKIK